MVMNIICSFSRNICHSMSYLKIRNACVMRNVISFILPAMYLLCIENINMTIYYDIFFEVIDL